MRAVFALTLVSILALTGCNESHVPQLDGGDGDLDGGDDFDGGGFDGGGPGDDAGTLPDDDAGTLPGDDAGTLPDDDAGTLPVPDAGTDGGPIDACATPGTVETVACGMCGTAERFCTAEHEWSYEACEGEGVCMPGTTDSVDCGNCGEQTARCTTACVWETTGTCTGEGICAPGARSRSGDGCPAGQQRDLLCSDACAFEPAGACFADGCPTPGLVETVACGTMCGSQERFCNASRRWEYGACTAGGVCEPGTTGSEACGLCGTRTTRCTTSCSWTSSGVCTGEGVCSPGTTRRTSTGCPAGQMQTQSCSASCGWTTTEACRPSSPVDVTVLLDVTGSHATRVRDQRALLSSRLVGPLLAIPETAVGVSFYADFPVSPYGTTGDRPFSGAIEPSLSAPAIDAALGTSPLMSGNDLAESGVEALSILTGGSVPGSATPLACSFGRTAGGCWRTGARRVVIVWTDAPHHNGPSWTSGALHEPYTTVVAAGWDAVRARMMSQGVELIVLYHDEFGGGGEARLQSAEMLTDLGQPATNAINATYTAAGGTGSLGLALDAAVARVRALSML